MAGQPPAQQRTVGRLAARPPRAQHRPAQFDSHDFWQQLVDAGVDPRVPGYQRSDKPEPFLAEWLNEGPGR